MQKLFMTGKGIVPALDTTDRQKLLHVVSATHDIAGIVAYKIGGLLAEMFGLPQVVAMVREITNKHLIYDRQKGATDIPDLGGSFAKLWREAGVDSAILFPLSGPVTQETWTKSCMDEGLIVWVGGHMTHPGFLTSDPNEEGYIDDAAPHTIYALAADAGVRHFIVPGNKTELVEDYRDYIDRIVGDGFMLGAPGFVKQGGQITEAAKVAGDNWVAIVGQDIVDRNTPDQMHQAALELVSQLNT